MMTFLFFFDKINGMKKICLSIFVLVIALFSSCSKNNGYGVVLWDDLDNGLRDGDIVPVYVKSNISHVYIVGANGKNVEVPIGMLSEPASKKKAEALAAKYSEFRHKYASAKIDGLPIRAEYVNTSKQVYRLRKDEVIKILYKGKGQVVSAGKNRQLEGDWLYVVASDGTKGWCFSYNLSIFEADDKGNRIGGEIIVEEVPDMSEIENIISNVWYPSEYASMIRNRIIDPDKLNPNNFFTLSNDKIIFSMPKVKESWTYSGVTKLEDNKYKLDGTSLIVIPRKNSLVLRYTGKSGKPEDFNVVKIEEDIESLVNEELDRRESLYMTICYASKSFKSSSYGQLEFEADHSFEWRNFKLLSPSIIPKGARAFGTVCVRYALDKRLASSYDGVLTFLFDGSEKEVNFLFKLNDDGIRLEDATNATFKNNVLVQRGLSPLVAFFSFSKR